jgi:hypothetical protein
MSWSWVGVRGEGNSSSLLIFDMYLEWIFEISKIYVSILLKGRRGVLLWIIKGITCATRHRVRIRS